MSLVSRSAWLVSKVPDRPTVSIFGLYEHAVSEINIVMIVIVFVFVIGSSLLDLVVGHAPLVLVMEHIGERCVMLLL
jgi:hypothetical protein